MITDETIKTIIENDKRISALLKENEELIKKDGLSTPVENYALNSEEKIQLPSGYIRVNEVFQCRYHLREIVTSQSIQKNIAYSLQLSDLHNYIINRFYVWGSVETMFYKNAIINLISIFEAFIFECVNNICCCPSTCGNISACSTHFSKNQRDNSSYDALLRMNKIEITDFTETELTRIKKLIDFRNRVHIRLAPDNEFISGDFSLSVYNETICLLQRVSDLIFKNGYPLYKKCIDRRR